MNFLSKYLGHLAAYVVSAAGLVASLDPAILPPQYAAVVAGAGLITALAHHSYKAGAAAAVLSAATGAVNSAATPVKLMIAVFLLAPLMFALHGCATVQKADAVLASPAAQPYIAAGVDVAVATAEAKGVTAAQINAIAHKALLADTGTAAPLAAIAGVINAELVKLNLPAGDLAAANILELSFQVAIQKQIGTDATVAASQAAVASVLAALIEATGG